MNSFKRPQCPYCGKKIDYITAWMLRRKGEYLCSRCRGISNVKMDMKTPYLAIGAVLTTLILYFIIYFLFKTKSLNALIWVLLPIFLFYIASIFLVRLKKPVVKKVPKKKNGREKSKNKNMNYHTSSMNYKSISNDWNAQDNFEHTKIV